MGYGRALLARDVGIEEEDFKKKAKKKSLWGSIGRTLGGVAAMAITGGAANPLTLGLLTGGASFLGGAAGVGLSKTGDLSKGRFFKSDRESAQKELGAFGTQNVVSSLKSGLRAGFGQASKLKADKLLGRGTGEAAKGLDFKGSFVGKGWDKYVTQPRAVKAAGEQARLAGHLQQRGDFAKEFGEGGGIASKRLQRSMPISTPEFSPQMPTDPSFEFGAGGGSERGLQRMRINRDVPEFSPQMPTDPSFEFADGGRMTGPTLSIPAYSQGTFYEKKWRSGHPMSGLSTIIGGK